MLKLDEVISIPGSEFDVTIKNEEHGYGLYEMQGIRPSQEDAALACWYGEGSFVAFTPQEIARRLWTTYKVLNQQCSKPGFGGSTASTVVYDGKGNLITATLGDSVAFAVVYGEDGHVSSVTRLNKLIHHPEVDRARLEQAGAVIANGRLQGKEGSLAISRAMGDVEYHSLGVCDEAHVDITPLSSLSADPKAKIQIIITCDGFTEPAPKQSKEGHEEWLLHSLLSLQNIELVKEADLAMLLALRAFKSKSSDNISVAVQTLDPLKPVLLGIYDGHNGTCTSVYIAQHLAAVFEEQCALEPQAYTQQRLSADKYFEVYCRDNDDKEFYQPLMEQKKARLTEVSKAWGVKEQIKRLATKKNEFVDEVVNAGEEIGPLMQTILAIVELDVFIESLCGKYIDLEIDKKDLLECFKYVLKENSLFEHEKYGFLPFDFKKHREVASLLKRQPGFSEILEDLYTLLLEQASPASGLGQHGLFKMVEEEENSNFNKFNPDPTL